MKWSDDLRIAVKNLLEVFNCYFANITQDREIIEANVLLPSTVDIEEPTDKAIGKYKNHHGI